MLSPTFILWDVGYPLYTYGSIIIIALIIWQVRKNHQDLRLGPNRSCCWIQQLLSGETTLTTPTSSGTSQGSSCLEVLSMSSLSFEQSQDSLHSKELSLPSATRIVSQLTSQKSLTRLAARSATKSTTKSTSAVSIHEYWADHQQLRQECQGPEVPWDVRALSSSSLEEPRIPVNQQDKKKSNSECVPEKRGQQPLNI
eukprot:bmy_22134T0